MVHASLLLFVVPVFTATLCPEITNGEFAPNVGIRAVLSDRTSDIVNATFFVNTFLGFGVYCSKIFPF